MYYKNHIDVIYVNQHLNGNRQQDDITVQNECSCLRMLYSPLQEESPMKDTPKMLEVSLFSSMRFKLIAVLLLVGLLPLVVVGTIAVRRASERLRQEAGNALEEVAFNASDKLDRNLFE